MGGGGTLREPPVPGPFINPGQRYTRTNSAPKVHSRFLQGVFFLKKRFFHEFTVQSFELDKYAA